MNLVVGLARAMLLLLIVFGAYFTINEYYGVHVPVMQLPIDDSSRPFFVMVFTLQFLVLLLVLTSLYILSKKKGGSYLRHAITWVLFSTVPGMWLIHVRYVNRFELESFLHSWDSFIWMFGVPLYIGLGQLLYLAAVLIRRYVFSD